MIILSGWILTNNKNRQTDKLCSFENTIDNVENIKEA
jgi:hypothetical protein